MPKLYINIGWLGGVGNFNAPVRGERLAVVEGVANAWLLCVHGKIEALGPMPVPAEYSNVFCIDLMGKTLIPGFCDSHTHLVFAATREQEFVQKLQGASYAQIAASGGGILHSAARVQAASEDVLYQDAWQRLQSLIAQGTAAIEIKTGYGLTVESELKMLRVINRLASHASIPVRRTLLAAHSIPLAHKQNVDAYVQQIINELIPAAEGMADYVDVFCEQGFFTNEHTQRICEAAAKAALKPKIHANQLSCTGAVQTAIAADALSADHLEQMDEESILALAQSQTIGTMLPTAAWFLQLPYPPARKLIQAGAALALASDYNPGSSPSGNMWLVQSMACVQMRMLPQEAYNAATINGAFAMGLGLECGSFAPGKRANGIVMPAGYSIASIPYHFGGISGIEILNNGTLL